MRCFHVNSATAQAAMPMFCCHCVAFSPALGRSPNFSCHSTYFHERFALTIDKRRARSSCCETFLPLAPCFFFTATKSLHCSSCCGVASNFISSTAVPIFTDDFGQHPHHSPRALSTRTSAHFFFHNLYSPSLPAISNQILHASC